MDIQAIRSRSQLEENLRKWFKEHSYLEVSTPLLSPWLIPEPTIANFATNYVSDMRKGSELYLVPSPEIFMKVLLKELKQSIYQISKCFRNKEQIGAHHNPEFTMLEYYTIDADEQDSIAITEQLLKETALPQTPEYARPPFIRMSVAEACREYASIDLESLQSVSSIRAKAKELSLTVPGGKESWEDTFHRIFLTFVEPNLPKDHPVVLTDYPSQIRCLAKEGENKIYRKRWELYIKGIEIANCYDEQIEQEAVRTYMEEEYALLVSERARTGEVIPDIDYSFASMFDETYPRSSGVAVGLDRLLMVQLGRTSLRDLILFRLSDMMDAGHIGIQ
ncbi:MAG: amino acid--tRNA ligase-related protein [Sphaerochaetaceae bacterium]